MHSCLQNAAERRVSAARAPSAQAAFDYNANNNSPYNYANNHGSYANDDYAYSNGADSTMQTIITTQTTMASTAMAPTLQCKLL